MEYTALIVGYAVIGILVLMILYLFIQWALYGEIGQSVSVKIVGGNVYVNLVRKDQLKKLNYGFAQAKQYEHLFN